MRFGETLSLSGLRPSVGSVGDAFDNALAETTIDLYKTECVRADAPFRRGPLRNVADVELITADYVLPSITKPPRTAPPTPSPRHPLVAGVQRLGVHDGGLFGGGDSNPPGPQWCGNHVRQRDPTFASRRVEQVRAVQAADLQRESAERAPPTPPIKE